MTVATHGCRRSRHSSLGLIVPSKAPLVESVNFTLPIGPTNKPGRTLAVSVADPEGSMAPGEATSVVLVAKRKSLAMLGAAVTPSPAAAITVVVAMRTSRRTAPVGCPRIW